MSDVHASNGQSVWSPRTGREDPADTTKINVLLQENQEIVGHKLFLRAQLIELIDIYNQLVVEHVQHIEQCAGSEAAKDVENSAHQALLGVVQPENTQPVQNN